MKIRVMYAVVGLIFGILISGSLMGSSDLILGVNHWQQNDDVLIPINSSVDVGLNNNSLLWANLSSYAGDNMSWDPLSQSFDVVGSGFGVWKQEDNVLYPKVNGVDLQLNTSAGSRSWLFDVSINTLFFGVETSALYDAPYLSYDSGVPMLTVFAGNAEVSDVNGGKTLIQGGVGKDSGDGGEVEITAGDGGSSGSGGDVCISSGSGSSGYSSGDVIIQTPSFLPGVDSGSIWIDSHAGYTYMCGGGLNLTDVVSGCSTNINANNSHIYADNMTASQVNVQGASYTWNIYVNSTGVLVWERETI